VRARELELRKTVNATALEPGMRALVELAQIERDKALEAWRRATGEDLVKWQSRYNGMQQIIDFVNEKPREFEQRGEK